jgi:hypothetical protein
MTLKIFRMDIDITIRVITKSVNNTIWSGTYNKGVHVW